MNCSQERRKLAIAVPSSGPRQVLLFRIKQYEVGSS